MPKKVLITLTDSVYGQVTKIAKAANVTRPSWITAAVVAGLERGDVKAVPIPTGLGAVGERKRNRIAKSGGKSGGNGRGKGRRDG